MNREGVRRLFALVVLLLALLPGLAGCTGTGPAMPQTGYRPRCASGAPDDQRPMFFLFCAESP